MKDLTIGTQTISLKVENGKAFATSLDIAIVFNKRHDNVIRKIKALEGFNDYRGLLKIEETSYIDKWNRKQLSYKLDRDIFVLVVSKLTGGKAERYIYDFIQAFNLLEDEYFKTQKTLTVDSDKDLVLEHILPFSPKDTISKVNGLKKDKLVRSYYRSKNGKELKLLDKAIAELKESLFEHDEDMLIELINRRNQLVSMRNEFIDLIS